MSDILSANIRRLDVGALIALSKLLAQRNVSRVAREVGLSQPAMSHLLARLRTAFGDELLVRDGTGLVLTAAGAQLQARLEAALPHLLGVFAGETFDPASSFVHFKLGITDHAGQVLLPGLLAELHERAPRATVSVAVIPNRQTDLSALDEGRYDLRFGWLRSLPPQWHRRKLLDDRIVLIASADHPGLSEPMTIEDFAALDHVALESERPIYPNLVDRYLASCGLQRRVVVRVSHFAIAPSIVAGTRMVAMFPERLARTVGPGIRIIEPPLDFPDPNLSMAWHPRVHASVESVWLRQLVVDQCQRLRVAGEAAPG
ncbi:MAG: LysR family transcriptional regulator [Sphingomonadales bacterium]|nr:LysR family transcriptional regulator [Sphingomonadales bacterium]